jgi:hypothetical protein
MLGKGLVMPHILGKTGPHQKVWDQVESIKKIKF